MLISPAYRAMNAEMHRQREDYGKSGHLFAEAVQGVIDADPGIVTALDYGCGKGTLKGLVPGVIWSEYDPAIPGKDADPMRADLVACTEVLEHVEPECLDTVLHHLNRLTGRICIMSVAFDPAAKSLPDGRNAHLIVKPREWWDKKLAAYFEVVKCWLRTKPGKTGMTVVAIPMRKP